MCVKRHSKHSGMHTYKAKLSLFFPRAQKKEKQTKSPTLHDCVVLYWVALYVYVAHWACVSDRYDRRRGGL